MRIPGGGLSRTGVDGARVVRRGIPNEPMGSAGASGAARCCEGVAPPTRSGVCKTLTQSLTREHFGRQAPTLSKEKTRRFQRVSLIAGAGFEPATFGL